MHRLGAVLHAAEVRLLALEALIKGTLFQDILIRLVVVLAALRIDWFHVDFAFGLEFPRERQDLTLELQKLVQICIELRILLEKIDWRLAGRASYEVKRDAQSAPSMSE